jgi:hypothetical protein
MVCVRRLVLWLGSLEPPGRAGAARELWSIGGEPDCEPWREPLRAAFAEKVAGALAEFDGPGRAGVAIAWLEMGCVPEALEALSGVAPALAESGGLPDRTLISLLSRLLDSSVLAGEARARLAAAIYPAS